MMAMLDRSRGFSLIETLVATALLTTIVAGVAQLTSIASRANQLARIATVTTLLAAGKMEALQSVQWTSLLPSPAGTLSGDVAGHCEFFDARGRPLDGGPPAPAGAKFVRRWSIAPLAARPADLMRLEVIAAPWPEAAVTGPAGGRAGEARVLAVRGRREP